MYIIYKRYGALKTRMYASFSRVVAGGGIGEQPPPLKTGMYEGGGRWW
jgi:hypothetical protein